MLSALELINKIKARGIRCDESLISKAYQIASEAHQGQFRYSGEHYFIHPVEVAKILIDLGVDQDSIITALLHDVVEDTSVTLSDIENIFGEQIAKMVNGVTKLGKIDHLKTKEKAAENLRKLIIATSEDVRVLLVKLADRLHNMRTLHHIKSKEKQQKKADESLNIYAPLAARLGLNQIKDEIQDIAFRITSPEIFKQITDNLEEIRKKNQNLIIKIEGDLKNLLKDNGIEAKVNGREKKPYSIWIKMRKRNVGFHNLHDIMAFRIILNEDYLKCYEVLGIINSTYRMIPGSFKDYISTPKENGYQSLHLTTIGPFNKKIEIQIRNQKMHEISEFGLAAHWSYKQGVPTIEKEGYGWIKDLILLFENAENVSDVLKDHQFSIHLDEVFCFTPNGDIFNLQVGSSMVDFAYAIHSKIGDRCSAVKVNGIITPLRQKVENGDQIEVITSENAKPSISWLQFVITSKAKSAIRNFVRNEKYDEYVGLGKTILSKFFVSKGFVFDEESSIRIINFFHKKSINDIYFKIAEGLITRHTVLKAAYPDFKDEEKHDKIRRKLSKFVEVPSQFFIGMLANMICRYANCCHPILGDQISGVINIGSDVTIHRSNCEQVKKVAQDSYSILPVMWNEGFESHRYSVARLKLVIDNSAGSLAEITNIISQNKINIRAVKNLGHNESFFETIIDLEAKNLSHLEEIISCLRISKKIISVERL